MNFTVYPSLKHLSYFFAFVTTGYVFLHEYLCHLRVANSGVCMHIHL